MADSWGSVPRVFEGIQWLPPRAAVQILRFGLWLDSLTGVVVRLSLQFGRDPIIEVDLSSPEAQKQLIAGAWNNVEIRVDLNAQSHSVSVGGSIVFEAGINLDRNVTEVLFEGGPAFLSELELRTEPIAYARGYRSDCRATPPLASISLCGSRIGALATTGDAFIKDLGHGDSGAFWTWVSGDVKHLVLDGTRIGVVKRDGTVHVKEGALDAGWNEVSWDVGQLVLQGSRIGVLKMDGTVFVKEGALDAPWTEESWNIAQLVLDGTRIGVLAKDGTVFVKEGPLDAPWTEESWGAATFALSGDEIVVLNRSGTAFFKRGALDAMWWQLNGSCL